MILFNIIIILIYYHIIVESTPASKFKINHKLLTRAQNLKLSWPETLLCDLLILCYM